MGTSGHQDNNREGLPVQAVLMLNRPGPDFQGGQFYVARQQLENSTENGTSQDVLHFHRYLVEWAQAGDLVLFLAGKETKWWHGMMPVKQGKEETNPPETSVPKYAREAIGMLQPL